jgi:hypothetical protein
MSETKFPTHTESQTKLYFVYSKFTFLDRNLCTDCVVKEHEENVNSLMESFWATSETRDLFMLPPLVSSQRFVVKVSRTVTVLGNDVQAVWANLIQTAI